jgi:hypothetical protein
MKSSIWVTLVAGIVFLASNGVSRADDLVRLGTGVEAQVSNLNFDGQAETQKVWLLRRLLGWGCYGGWGHHHSRYQGSYYSQPYAYGGYPYGGCYGYGGYTPYSGQSWGGYPYSSGYGMGGYGGGQGGYGMGGYGMGGYGGGYGMGGYGGGYGMGGYGGGYGMGGYGGGYGMGGYGGGYGMGGYGGGYGMGGYGMGGYGVPGYGYGGGGYGYGGYPGIAGGYYGGNYPVAQRCSDGPRMPSAVNLGAPHQAPTQGLAPAPGNGNYPYDGGPAFPLPLPSSQKQFTNPPQNQPTIPREGLLISLPRQSSGFVSPAGIVVRTTTSKTSGGSTQNQYTYPAYGDR